MKPTLKLSSNAWLPLGRTGGGTLGLPTVLVAAGWKKGIVLSGLRLSLVPWDEYRRMVTWMVN